MTQCASCKRSVDYTKPIELRITVLDGRDRERLLCVPCWIKPGAGAAKDKK